MKKPQKGIETSHWKVGDADGFQAVDPVDTDEEPEIAECYNIEEDENSGTQKQKEGSKKKCSSKILP